ncbi:MAG: SMI1/KNR4 family protein [Pirellulales bacterium]
MDERLRNAVRKAFAALPEDCRYAPATATQLLTFEREFGPIPNEMRWFLSECGGGVCGSEWIDGITELTMTHRKFHAELCPGGWTMTDVFVIGWDGAGNPFGIHCSGEIVVEDHNFDGIHVVAASLGDFLARGLIAS